MSSKLTRGQKAQYTKEVNLLKEDFDKFKKEAQMELDKIKNSADIEYQEIKNKNISSAEKEEKIKKLKESVSEKVTEIINLHRQIFTDTGESDSFKKQIEDLLFNSNNLFSETEEKKEDFDEFYDKVFGVKNEETGEVEGGLKNELDKYTKKYDKLFTEIENLLPGATSAGLAGVFSKKVEEYKRAEEEWTKIFIGFVVVLAIYYGINVLVTNPSSDYKEAFLRLIHKLPFLLFAIWALIFAGNRRAESKKLEESYKHKEVMSRSYVGYKDNIEDLEDDEEDKKLLKKHMENLLDSIKIESGKFLNNEGDKHPFWSWLIKKDVVIGKKENNESKKQTK